MIPDWGLCCLHERAVRSRGRSRLTANRSVVEFAQERFGVTTAPADVRVCGTERTLDRILRSGLRGARGNPLRPPLLRRGRRAVACQVSGNARDGRGQAGSVHRLGTARLRPWTNTFRTPDLITTVTCLLTSYRTSLSTARSSSESPPNMGGLAAQSRDVTVVAVAPITQAPRRNLLPANDIYRQAPLLLLCIDCLTNYATLRARSLAGVVPFCGIFGSRAA
jgi:hypothetical protein